MVGLVEETLLVLLDDETGRLAELGLPMLNIVTSAAVLMELSLLGRIDTDLDELIVTDRRPTGEAYLDPALATIGAHAGRHPAGHFLYEISFSAQAIRDTALDRLVARGILQHQEERFLWVFRTRRYPVLDDTNRREVRARLHTILTGDELPDPHDCLMISLLDATGLVSLVLSAAEWQAAAERISRLARIELLGRVLARAVRDIRGALGMYSGHVG
jgi:hypothetical protein